MKNVTLGEIAQFLEAELDGYPHIEVTSFAPIESAKKGQLSFIASQAYEKYINKTEATALLVRKDFSCKAPEGVSLLRVDDPYLALTKLMKLASAKQFESYQGVSPKASIAPSIRLPEHCYIGDFVVIEEGAIIGEGVKIFPHCYIGSRVKIGACTLLYPRVTLYPGVEIGSHCILHAGVVIGSDGFGFTPCTRGYEKIPQLGTVQVGNDVEIGANSTIDRAMLEATTISDGVKIDNLVQVGHNCSIGAHTVISAQTGIAGSTTIGKWCRIGGQVGFSGHQEIGNECEIGAQSGILGNLPDKSRVLGSPQMPANSALRSYVLLSHLPELSKEIYTLKKKLSTIEKKCDNKP